jgi:hypothetical protein
MRVCKWMMPLSWIKIIFQVKIHITQVIASNCLQILQKVKKTIREPIYAAICGTIKCNKCIEIYCGSNYLNMQWSRGTVSRGSRYNNQPKKKTQKKLKNTHTNIAGQCPLVVSVSVVLLLLLLLCWKSTTIIFEFYNFLYNSNMNFISVQRV